VRRRYSEKMNELVKVLSGPLELEEESVRV